MTPGLLWTELTERLLPVHKKYRRDRRLLDTRSKPDKTLLTDADLEVQGVIIDAIRRADPGGRIIAEEGAGEAGGCRGPSDRVWVIDPIDGTAQFVNPASREFCSVVCLLEQGVPVEAYVLMPEAGPDGHPLVVTASHAGSSIMVDETEALRLNSGPPLRRASVTRSSGSPRRPFESLLESRGITLKTRTTSQTLDMLRTGIDFSSHTDLDFEGFDFFMRREQKIWDGVAGMCIGAIAGLAIVDEAGKRLLPVPTETLCSETPMFESSILGRPDAVSELIGLL